MTATVRPAPPDDEAELQRLDALYAQRGEAWWDGFYADRARPCPFFVSAPDESLVRWFEDTGTRPARVLDLGASGGHFRGVGPLWASAKEN